MNECAYQELSRGIGEREACDQYPMRACCSRCNKGHPDNGHPKNSKKKPAYAANEQIDPQNIKENADGNSYDGGYGGRAHRDA